jgi:hypothetical protein
LEWRGVKLDLRAHNTGTEASAGRSQTQLRYTLGYDKLKKMIIMQSLAKDGGWQSGKKIKSMTGTGASPESKSSGVSGEAESGSQSM